MVTWTRIDTGSALGYERGRYQIFDNGAGLGPSQGSGRWALVIDGRWVANLDTLALAKAAADEDEARAASRPNHSDEG